MATKTSEFLKILGLKNGATDADIKKAYRRLAQKHHPDRNKGAASAEAKFKEVKNAYEHLTEPEKREAADLSEKGWSPSSSSAPGFGAHSQNNPFQSRGGFPGGDYQSFFDDSGLFESVFGGQIPLGDIHANLELPLTDCIKGTTRSIRYSRHAPCLHCASHTPAQKKRCSFCHGAGLVQEEKSIQIKIPAGIDTGQTIRIPKGGSFAGQDFGNLLIDVVALPDPMYVRAGKNLRCRLPVDSIEAILGCTVSLETIYGAKLELKIPPDTDNGTVLKLTGQGVTTLNGHTRGDLLVEIVLTTEKWSAKAKALFEKAKQA